MAWLMTLILSVLKYGVMRSPQPNIPFVPPLFTVESPTICNVGNAAFLIFSTATLEASTTGRSSSAARRIPVVQARQMVRVVRRVIIKLFWFGFYRRLVQIGGDD